MFDSPTSSFVLGSHTRSILSSLTSTSFAPYAHELPGNAAWAVRFARKDDLIIFSWEERNGGFASSSDAMAEEEVDYILAAMGPERRYPELRANARLAPYFGPRRLLIVLEVVDGEVDGAPWEADVLDWLSDEPWRVAQRNNLERVRDAVPEPPSWNVDAIVRACWVVESSEGCVQGTAFALEGVGFVTCHHVLHAGNGHPHADVVLFQPQEPSRRYEIRDIRSNAVLDLAVFNCEAAFDPLVADASEISPMSHVAVCGYPNYRAGQTCSVSPGLIVAIRPSRGGIRRLLTNAGIVAGMSGGPAVARDGIVAGVCANGAQYLQDLRETEDQSIIPISALDLLG